MSFVIGVLSCFAICTSSIIAKPVRAQVRYSDIHSISNKIDTKTCRSVIRNGTYTYDRNRSVSFKMSPNHFVKNSSTLIREMDGKDTVLVKYGKSILMTKKGKFTADRISYVRIKPNGDASGQIVLVGLCKANFSSKRI